MPTSFYPLQFKSPCYCTRYLIPCIEFSGYGYYGEFLRYEGRPLWAIAKSAEQL
jgi:hypothetical protein